MSENIFLGLPTNISQVDLEFLKHKCETAVLILKADWAILLPKCRDFLSLVDKQKVSFDISVRKLNEILESGFFTAEEERLIKKLRYQGRNNLAAKSMRERYRVKDEVIQNEIEVLRQEKQFLIQEKASLTHIIMSYKSAIEQEYAYNLRKYN
ncbi:hypothetical protein LOD99_13660 [Oopsacas minuta]|uniref:BZIP domain-containing protein n=1 Tax=Oopsacas minuta TaxID=111878 RepID=A0AAV7KHQ5_9METZ|nr:hypothetical protein LOD99_13660 [Oopsacas minuta]